MATHPSVVAPAATTPPDARALRRRAEAIARNYLLEGSRGDTALSHAQVQQTLYELRVRQIELEMQNEELRQAQLRLNDPKDAPAAPPDADAGVA